jgi:hypothetical protein
MVVVKLFVERKRWEMTVEGLGRIPEGMPVTSSRVSDRGSNARSQYIPLTLKLLRRWLMLSAEPDSAFSTAAFSAFSVRWLSREPTLPATSKATAQW